MDYPLMEPPFEIKPFKQMSKTEAKAHFEWYISELPNRIDLLGKAFELTSGKSKDMLDFSPPSLTPLWEWFKTQIRQDPKPEVEIEAERSQLPEHLRPHVEITTLKLSRGTTIIAMDIAAYFGEIFVRNHSSVNWGFVTKPLTFADVNQPVLTGFLSKAVLNPRQIVKNLTLRAVDNERSDDSLEEMYNNWVGCIEK